MNRDFLDLYQLELKQLYEKSRQFADEYPGVARRLGGLIEDKMDPGIAGLLEGAAFMAARVQLKIKSEFPEFTSALLDQLVPDYLAPIPSAALVEVVPSFDDGNLKDGIRFAAGSHVDAVYVEQQKRDILPLPSLQRACDLASPSGGGPIFRGASAAAGARPGNPAGRGRRAAARFSAQDHQARGRPAGRHTGWRAGRRTADRCAADPSRWNACRRGCSLRADFRELPTGHAPLSRRFR